MTTIDCAVFNLFEHGHAVAHSIPFADEWTDFTFTRTESNGSMQAPIHRVSDDNTFRQDDFAILRLCSQDKPQTDDSQFEDLKHNLSVPAFPKELFACDTVASKKEMCTVPLFGSDAPQGQQISASYASKAAQHCQFHYPAVPTHTSTWEVEPYTSHQSTHHFVATTTAEAPPAAAPSKKRSRQNKKPVFWTNEEHEKFLAALRRFNGDDQDGLGAGVAELISIALGSRTVTQVRSHAQKYFLRLRQQ